MLLELEKKYPDSIMVIDLPENCRQGGARNVGINYASADYIGFVDSDDWIEHDMYEKMYSKIIEYNCDAVTCSAFTDYPYGRATGGILGEGVFITSEKPIKDKENSWECFSVGVWNALYRKSIIIDNQIFFPKKLAYEDNYWTSIIRLYIKSCYVLNEPLYHYCVNIGSVLFIRKR